MPLSERHSIWRPGHDRTSQDLGLVSGSLPVSVPITVLLNEVPEKDGIFSRTYQRDTVTVREYFNRETSALRLPLQTCRHPRLRRTLGVHENGSNLELWSFYNIIVWNP